MSASAANAAAPPEAPALPLPPGERVGVRGRGTSSGGPVVGSEAAGIPGAQLVGVVAVLVGIGLVMVYSASAAERAFDPTAFLRRQAIWAVVAAIALVLLWQTDYHALVRARWPIIAVATVLLVLVMVPGIGSSVKGASRWIRFGGGSIGLQPSELAKLAVAIFLAGAAARPGALATFRGTVRVLAVAGVPIVLVAAEPDFGTGALLAALSALVLVVAGAKLHHLAALGGPAVAAVALYGAARFEHVRERIEVWLHPDADPLGKGYQIRQALIALGSGGPLGVGLGEGKQKLLALPDDHTDFILAIVGEELGFIGTTLVVLLFATFLWYGLRIAWRARDTEGFLLAFGIVAAVSLQAAMNVAVVTAAMPTKGISLPFLSFGGSYLLFALASVGILLNVAAQGREHGHAEGLEAPSTSTSTSTPSPQPSPGGRGRAT